MWVVLCLTAALLAFVTTAQAEEKEPTAIIELGGLLQSLRSLAAGGPGHERVTDQVS